MSYDLDHIQKLAADWRKFSSPHRDPAAKRTVTQAVGSHLAFMCEEVGDVTDLSAWGQKRLPTILMNTAAEKAAHDKKVVSAAVFRRLHAYGHSAEHMAEVAADEAARFPDIPWPDVLVDKLHWRVKWLRRLCWCHKVISVTAILLAVLAVGAVLVAVIIQRGAS